MIIHASNAGLLEHPLCPNLPPVVLQYADDTLIMVKATTSAAHKLKLILEDFALATGLNINYGKSTFIPIHLDHQAAADIAQSLGTTISSFPQTYLGLPLSTHKIGSLDIAPLFSTAEKYLAGWQANLLNKGGRLAIMTSVLDTLPTYIMSCFPLAKQDIEKYNKKRRSFFWTAEDTCTGAQCLVAWDRVCTPKSAGGLGVKNLEIQNGCLLLKFAYKFLHSADLPWKTGFYTTHPTLCIKHPTPPF